MSVLQKIKKCDDIKTLGIDELGKLSDEVREKIISVTKMRGGHLASSLGAVDFIVALAFCFDFLHDKVLFDVGHQAYAYKILTDRKDNFDSLRTFSGLSGFPCIFESKYDKFSSGHAGDCLGASLGYCFSRDLNGNDEFVIAVIGDGAFLNGETLEALFYSAEKPDKLLVILNDNGMSISKNSSGLFGNEYTETSASLKSVVNFEKLGFDYKGPIDGHDLSLLVKAFNDFKLSRKPTLLHIKTQKGKGYAPAEAEKEYYHGVSKDYLSQNNDFSDAIGDVLLKQAENNDKIVVIVAGMSFGTGTDVFKKRFPERFIDVGICEDLAVTVASSCALSGLRPIVVIYSTFLQRAYDQIVTNVCMQKLPIVFLIDRAGVVGADGQTHQGTYDISYLSHIPGMRLFAPKNPSELNDMLQIALKDDSGYPVAVRYPNGTIDSFVTKTRFTPDNLWEVYKEGNGKCIFAVGPVALKIAIEASKNTDACVVNARCVKPLDIKTIKRFENRDIITVEDNVKYGGFGSIIATYLSEIGYKNKLKIFAIDDEFIPQGTKKEQLDFCNLTADNIKKELI